MNMRFNGIVDHTSIPFSIGQYHFLASDDKLND
jgi:hypothetical protein